MLSLAALGLLWIAGVLILILYTVDEDQPAQTRRNKPDGRKLEPSTAFSGLGGEISRLEARFSDQELELEKAAYLANHKHHNHVHRVDGKIQWIRREAR